MDSRYKGQRYRKRAHDAILLHALSAQLTGSNILLGRYDS